jgi:hypothetical protein
VYDADALIGDVVIPLPEVALAGTYRLAGPSGGSGSVTVEMKWYARAAAVSELASRNPEEAKKADKAAAEQAKRRAPNGIKPPPRRKSVLGGLASLERRARNLLRRKNR